MPNYDPLLTMSALNMAIVSLHRITSSGDRLVLDREYDRIINNLRMGEINSDPELKELYLKIVRVIQNGRLREDVRAAIRQADSDKKRKSIKEIITGNVLKSFSTNPLKWLGKLAVSSAAEYFTQEKEAERDKSNDSEQLRLRRDELDEYAELQRQLLNSSWTLLRQYHLPDEYRLTQGALAKISRIMNEPDPANRHKMMKYLEREFSMYAPYWLYRAKFASESGSDDEAEKCFARFNEVWRPVLRKDPYRAEAMKFRIESLMRSGVNQGNAGEILKCLAEMRGHTDIEDWANNIFAGIIYFSLGMRDEAVDCVMCNVLFHYEEEMSSQVLERMETEELPPRVEPLPLSEPEPPAHEELPEPKPKTQPMSDDDFLKLCESGDAVKVEEAITNGANVNAKDNYGRTTLMYAGNADVAEVLLKHGANVNAKDNHGMTTLMCAAIRGHADVAEVLIKHGADVNAKNNGGWTALMEAAIHGHADVAEVLIKHGADVNAKDNHGDTALIYAAWNGHADVAEVLLKHGADVNAKDNDGDTALMLAARKGLADVAEVLLKHGADVNAKINDGGTVLMFAAINGHADVAEVLLKHGADVNAKDNDGETALMFAAINGHADVAEVLIKHGADVNAKSISGYTALMFAAKSVCHYADVAEVLLKHGADVNAKKNDGKTALVLAKEGRHKEIVRLLRSYGAKEGFFSRLFS